MRRVAIGLLFALLGAAQVPPVIDTPEATYIPVVRPGFAATFLTGIAANARISGVSTVATPMSGVMPPQYVNAEGFLLSGGVFTDITHPSVTGSMSAIRFTCPLKVNTRGEVVGWAANSAIAGEGEVGFVWRRGAFQDVQYTGPDTPGLDPAVTYTKITDVMGINAQGEMVGQVAWIHPDDPNVPVSHWRGWIYSKGRFTLIDPPGSLLTYPADINERGEVVGVYRDQPMPPRPGFVMRKDGSFAKIVLPEDWNALLTFPQAINAAGVIAGFYRTWSGEVHGFLLNVGQVKRIDVPGAVNTAIYGINEDGLMVGAWQDASGVIRGFIRIPKQP